MRAGRISQCVSWPSVPRKTVQGYGHLSKFRANVMTAEATRFRIGIREKPSCLSLISDDLCSPTIVAHSQKGAEARLLGLEGCQYALQEAGS